MPRETFIDTSGFYAILVKRDDKHTAAVRRLRAKGKNRRRFVTTDYVLDETSTLLKARGHGHLLPQFFTVIFGSQVCDVEWMDPTRFQACNSLFLKHLDHDWSFTDCMSFVVMRERKLTDALTKDAHFREAGFAPLLV